MPEKLKFGLPFLLETATVEEAVSLASKLGLAFVELNSNFPPCLIDELDTKELLQYQAKTGLFFTYHLDDHLNFLDFNPLVQEASIRTVLDAIALAKSANFKLLNLHFPRGGVVTLPDGVHTIFGRFPEKFMDHVKTFAEACQRAVGDAPLKLAIENTDAWLAHERKAIETLLDYPAFGLTLDIGHDHATHNQDLPFFMEHAEKLIHMHAHDGYQKVNHQALGTGEIPPSAL